MKKHYYLLILAASLISYASIGQNCKLVADTAKFTFQGEESRYVSEYLYNSSEELVRINYYFNTPMDEGFYPAGYDLVTYAGGKITSLVNYNSMDDQPSGDVMNNVWSNGLLVEQNRISNSNNEDPDHIRKDTTFYTYTSGVLSSVDTRRWEGDEKDTEGSEVITNIVITNGNITSAKRGGVLDVSLEYDEYPAVYLGLPITDEFIEVFSVNNVIKVYPNISPETPFIESEITYTDDDVVAHISTSYGSESIEEKGFKYDCSSVLGVTKNTDAQQVNFYPNPSSEGKFKLEATDLSFRQFTVINSNGQVVQHGIVSSTEVIVDLAGLPMGIYTVQLKGDQRVAFSKLVKQ